MEKQKLKEEDYQQISRIAILVTIACVLQIAESLVPHPIPGIRLGLANTITLITLVTIGFSSGLEVAVLRTILSSLVMGTFMSPTFILSFAGAVLSTFVMGGLYWLVRRYQNLRLSIVGISVMGALSHNFTQLLLAYFLLIKHPGIFVFWPWFAVGSVIMGWFSGLVSGSVCSQLNDVKIAELDLIYPQNKSAHAQLTFSYSAGDSFLHRLPAHLKINALLLFSLAVIISSNFWLYLVLFSLLAIIIILAKIFPSSLVFNIKRYISFILVAFFLPVFFNHGGQVVCSIAHVKFTSAGLYTGFLFAARIILLVVADFLLLQSTSAQDLASGLARSLSLLKVFRISPKRIAAILSLSLISFPVFWEHAKKSIQAVNLKSIKNVRAILPALAAIIVSLYLGDEQRKVVAANYYKEVASK